MMNGSSMPLSGSVNKIREIMMRNCDDSECGEELPELDFVYADCEHHLEEMAQLYSYGECGDFVGNLACFDELMMQHGYCRCWMKSSPQARRNCVNRLLDLLDVAVREVRLKAMRALLYIAQGCFAEVQSDVAQQCSARDNVLLLVECGAVPLFVQLLHFELQEVGSSPPSPAAAAAATTDSPAGAGGSVGSAGADGASAAGDGGKSSAAAAGAVVDRLGLRTVLNMLYTLVETVRVERDAPELRASLRHELTQPLAECGEQLLVVSLLDLVVRQNCNSGAAPTLPVKKVLLLVWKLLLFTLGDWDELSERRRQLRAAAGLKPVPEDTVRHTRTIHSCHVSPGRPASGGGGGRRLALTKQSSLDEQAERDLESQQQQEQQQQQQQQESEQQLAAGAGAPGGSPQPSTALLAERCSSQAADMGRRLPWTPKVRQCDVVAFIESARTKFVGMSLQDDVDTTAGLPPSITEGVNVLKNYLYSSLAELQMQREEEYDRYPASKKELHVDQCAAEVLYTHLLPTLPQYVIALLKVLLAAAPTSGSGSDSSGHCAADLLPAGGVVTAEAHSVCLTIDTSRQKEVIVKAISASILLLLKHFKHSHIYQFECVSQHLVFANCIPLVLKFFNQETMCYIAANNSIPVIDFPSCVIGDQPELTIDNLQIGDHIYSWRNLFSSINLLRILNKLCKWKPSRIMMLVMFKSPPILKRLLLLKHTMVQVYTLKLLKMQTKYLGRQWRKSNMRTVSAIYGKVRHHFNDDWAFGNDVEARPWDFRDEERHMRVRVERFNERRYGVTVVVPSGSGEADESGSGGGAGGGGGARLWCDEQPGDYSLTTALAQPVKLTRKFKRHYGRWLQREVFHNKIDWDRLIGPGYIA